MRLLQLGFDSTPVLIKLGFPDNPPLVKDLNEKASILLTRERATKAPMKQPRQERLRNSETKNQILERNLCENQDLLIAAEAEHGRERQDKETETSRIVRDLQEHRNDARGLYGGYTQFFTRLLGPQLVDDLDLDYSLAVRRITELAWFRDLDPELLTRAVVLTANKKYQEALIQLDMSISATPSLSFHANAMLLKSNALRVSGDPTRGLEVAEQAVHIANENGWHPLVGKAQFYRGLCFFDLKLYADAIRCYVRAASIRWYAREIASMITIAEEKKNALPTGSPGKQLSEGFREIPLSSTASDLDASPMQF